MINTTLVRRMVRTLAYMYRDWETLRDWETISQSRYRDWKHRDRETS